MSMLANTIDAVMPYEFSPTVLLVCGTVAWLYVRGKSAGIPQERYRAVLFWLGWGLMYAMLQTRFDYYAQHMFFLHRLQHLILHHLAPFVIALAGPGERLMAGVPVPLRLHVIVPLLHSRRLAGVMEVVQQPLISGTLFVGLIYFWLIPDVHFIAMLNLPLYDAMNWGMAVDGLLFWWMVFNMREAASSAARHYGGRLVLLFVLMFPQILIGAHIALSRQDLFDIYEVCGRVWPLSARVDQQIGGLITWIPAAMMSIAGGLVLLQRWMRQREHMGEGAACQEHP